MKHKMLLIFLLLISSGLYAQINITGINRTRAEFLRGYKQLPSDTNTFAFQVNQRTGMKFNYRNELIETNMTFLDARIWGAEFAKPSTNFLSVTEGYVRLFLPLNWSITAGRQLLSIDNERLIGKRDWNLKPTSHDALTINYDSEKTKFQVISAFNQSEYLYDGTNYKATGFYKVMNMLWFSYKFSYLTLATMHVIDGFQSVNNANVIYIRYTPSVLFSYITDTYKLNMRLFYQTGKSASGTNIDAYYAEADFYSRFSKAAGFTIGTEIISGEKMQSGNLIPSFNLLYGTVNRFNGNIDYFSNQNNSLAAGLINPFVKLDFKFGNRLTLNTDFHYFRIIDNTLYQFTEKEKTLGYETDLSLIYKPIETLNLKMGYSIFIPNSSMAFLTGGNSNYFGNYAYLMLTISPELFSNVKK